MSSRHTGPSSPCGHDPPMRGRRAPNPNSARSRGFDMRKAIASERRRAAMHAEIERQYHERVRQANRGEVLLARLADRLAEFISPSTPAEQIGTQNSTTKQDSQWNTESTQP